VAIAPAELAAPDRRQLRRQIARARRADPQAFAAVARLRSRLAALARRQRGRMVNVVLPLRSLGRAGLMPMLAELAFEAQRRGGLSDRAWRGWQVSLLEVTGSLRDQRARPVLAAILAGVQRDAAVLRGAARALGRLDSGEAAAALAELQRRPGTTRQLAVLAGLGECRHPRAARALGLALVQAGEDGAVRRVAIRSLGRVGNRWAWKALVRAGRAKDARATQRVALDALLGAYPTLRPPEREAAAKAVLMISHPDTRARIAAARAELGPQGAAALDELQQRVNRDGLLR
jgi:hypothetical protein